MKSSATFSIIRNFLFVVILLSTITGTSLRSQSLNLPWQASLWPDDYRNPQDNDFGQSIAIGDVNGDGKNEIVVSSDFWIYVYQGPEWKDPIIKIGPRSGHYSPKFNAVALADVNNDSIMDIIFGENEYNQGDGKWFIYAFYGKPEWALLTRTLILDTSQNDWSRGSPGETTGGSFGWSIANAGDLNADGIEDIIVGAPTFDTYGRAYVYYGSATGLPAHEESDAIIPRENNWTVIPRDNMVHDLKGSFGKIVSKDGHYVSSQFTADNFMISAPSADIDLDGNGYIRDNEKDIGSILIGPRWWPLSGDKKYGTQFSYTMGWAGDINGDGHPEILAGAKAYNTLPKIFLYLGDEDRINTDIREPEYDWSITNIPSRSTYSKPSLGSAGDLNLDLYGDLFIGDDSYNPDNVLGSDGRVYLFTGGYSTATNPTGLGTHPDPESAEYILDPSDITKPYVPNMCTSFGSTVVSGDLNSDGLSDLVVGDPEAFHPFGGTDPGARTGAIHIFYSDMHVITVTSPNGNEVLIENNFHVITWICANIASETVHIDLSVDNGSTWIRQFENIPNNGSVQWLVPKMPSRNCLIRITEMGGVFDISDQPFTILPNREKICFPKHSGVPANPNPPLIDGNVNDDLGWKGASRITFGEGSGEPHLTAQSLINNSLQLMYLSFEVRNDPGFDSLDVLVVSFSDRTYQGNSNEDRRIVVYPLCQNTGASGPDCQLTMPENKIDRLPRKTELYKNSQAWEKVLIPTPNLNIKVRSFPYGNTSAWNVEMQIPTSTITGGDDWLNITDDFLFYFNVIRVSESEGISTQFIWPKESPIITGDIAAYPFSPGEWGEAYLGTSGPCNGLSIHSADIGTNHTPSSVILFSEPPNTIENTFHAIVNNTGSAEADQVNVRFRMANWGLPAPDSWKEIPAENPGCLNQNYVSNPTCPDTVPPLIGNITGTKEFMLNYKVADEDIGIFRQNPHQCLLAEINSSSNTTIIQKSAFRNMDFIDILEFNRRAQISTKGYKMAPGQNMHRFMLHVSKTSVVKTIDSEKESVKSPVKYNWTANGYLYTGQKTTIAGKSFDNTMLIGSFGYIMTPSEPVRSLTYRLDGMEKMDDDMYQISIAPDDSAVISSYIKMVRKHMMTLSLHIGSALPVNDYANNYKAGMNYVADIDYYFHKKLSLVFFVGLNQMISKSGGTNDPVVNGSLNLRYYQIINPTSKTFIGGGFGYYFSDHFGKSTGGNLSAGFDLRVNSSIHLEVGACYNKAFSNQLEFIQTNAGIHYVL